MFNVHCNAYIPQGSFSDRVLWTIKMNNYFKETCPKYNILFFENSLYSLLTKDSGEIKDEYVTDMTHYNDKCIHHLDEEVKIFCESNNISL